MEMILPKGGPQLGTSDPLLSKVAAADLIPSAHEGLTFGDVRATSDLVEGGNKHTVDSECQNDLPCTEHVPSKEPPAYISAERRLIESVPTPLSAKRNLMNSLESTPRSHVESGKTSLPLEKTVVLLDLCG